MKKIILLILLLAQIGCGKNNSNSNSIETSANIKKENESVILLSRYTVGDYTTTTYSFRYLTRDDVDLTKNNWELLFEAREDFEDYFQVNTVVDDFSYIYDLGDQSCDNLKPEVPSKDIKHIHTWFEYSKIDLNNFIPQQEAKVKVGHCYLAFNSDRNGRLLSLFRVLKHTENISVEIGEIEVLDVK